MPVIYKIFRADEYAEFVSKSETRGAPIDIQDGYIHLSTADQVEETASKHFVGELGLKLLTIDSEALGAALKWEPSRGGALFPHFYGTLRLQDVAAAYDLPLRNGHHDFTGLQP
ncbi:MAG: DUF952 domain-containing protein [Pseudomonadota bacterium]